MDIIFLIKTYKFITQTSQQTLELFATNLFNEISLIIGVLLYIFEKTKLSLDVMITF